MAITGRISERKKIKIRTLDCDNPIFLWWKKKLGGYAYFGFHGALDESIKVGKEITTSVQRAQQNWKPYDIEYMQAFERVLSKNSQDRITCSADELDESDRATLMSMVDSPRILLLTNPMTWDTLEASGVPVGVKPMEVKIDGGNFNFGDADQALWSLSFVIVKQPNVNLYL